MTPPDATNRADTPRPNTVGTRYQAVQRLAVELGRAHNDNNYQFSILIVEFDGLSLATNRLGDARGNEALQKVTGVLMRDLDALDLCCQLRDDEFLLILPGTGQPKCRDLMERLGRHWSEKVSTRQADIGVSIGCASSPAQGSTMEGLFAAAEESMEAVLSAPSLPNAGRMSAPMASSAHRGGPPAGAALFGQRASVALA